MKKIFLIPLLFTCLSMASCKKESPAGNDLNNVTGTAKGEIPSMTTFATCDKWVISLFTNYDANLTDNYKALRFVFCADNTVTLSNDILSFNGHWYCILDKGNPNYLTLDFDFHSANPGTYWTNLEGTWKIIALTQDSIQLQNDAGTEMLSFVRSSK